MVIMKKAAESEAVIRKTTKFLESLELEYNDISLYILAFTHKSIVNERPDFTPEHNERLEFLGDAVLELVITDNLYKNFPDKPEGILTDIRSALVRGKNLAIVGNKLGISEYLLLGKGEDKGGGRENNYILANTIEAIIGAIFVDLGIQNAQKFIENHIYSTITDILKKDTVKDYKTLIQEYTQEQFDITPNYKVENEVGADHNKTFTVGIYLAEKQKAIGKGSSKKKAQEDAAKNLYNSFLESVKES